MKTSITVVLDRSGSMGAVRDDAIGGFNTFLEGQRRDADGTTMTLTQFDNEYEILCVERPVEHIAPLDHTTYVPRGSTALNDAIGRTILELDMRLERQGPGERPEQVLFVVLTDGHENASREFTTEQIRELVERHERKHGWTFVYLAADVDAFAEASMRGIRADRAYQFSKEAGKPELAFERMSLRVADYKRGADFAFTDEDRESS